MPGPAHILCASTVGADGRAGLRFRVAARRSPARAAPFRRSGRPLGSPFERSTLCPIVSAATVVGVQRCRNVTSCGNVRSRLSRVRTRLGTAGRTTERTPAAPARCVSRAAIPTPARTCLSLPRRTRTCKGALTRVPDGQTLARRGPGAADRPAGSAGWGRRRICDTQHGPSGGRRVAASRCRRRR